MKDSHIEILEQFNKKGLAEWLGNYSHEQLVVFHPEIHPEREPGWSIIVKTPAEILPGEEVIDSVGNFLNFLEQREAEREMTSE